MVDTHCHLNFKAFDGDLDSVVRRFTRKGGEALVVVGAKIDSSEKAIKISKQNSICYAAVGFHPHHVNEITSFGEIESKLESLTQNSKVVAIGETGIDYYRYKSYPEIDSTNKNKQKDLFEIHLNIANRNKLPLIIHCREAQEDLMNYISNFMKEKCLTGVFHCFDGSRQYLESVLALGFYIGFDGNITYKANEHLRNLVRETPFDRLVVETDSPYLTPLPFRGQRNEPSYLSYTISCVAEIKNKKADDVAQITAENARELFNF